MQKSMLSANTLGRDKNGWFGSLRGVICDICEIDYWAAAMILVWGCENMRDWEIMEEGSHYGEEIRGEKGSVWLAPEWTIGIRLLLLVGGPFQRPYTTLLCEPFCEFLQVLYDVALGLTNKSSRLDIIWSILSRVCTVFRVSGKAFRSLACWD